MNLSISYKVQKGRGQFRRGDFNAVFLDGASHLKLLQLGDAGVLDDGLKDPKQAKLEQGPREVLLHGDAMKEADNALICRGRVQRVVGHQEAEGEDG